MTIKPIILEDEQPTHTEYQGWDKEYQGWDEWAEKSQLTQDLAK